MSDTSTLFTAAYGGDLVTVTHATQDELIFLAGKVDSVRDVLDHWSLIAIHSLSEVEIHALGWRSLLGNTWITSRLVAVDLSVGAVRTRSGKTYLLGARDRPNLDPELRAHLVYALRTWGFEDVRP